MYQVFAECHPFSSPEHGLIAGLFLAGLVGGFTHCTVMCGPFVIAQAGALEKISSFALFPYHIGRISTYISLAVLFNTILNLGLAASQFKALIAAPMLMLAGIIFLTTAFPNMSALFPWVKFAPKLIPSKWFQAAYAFLSLKRGITGQLLLGMLLGLMPCGMVLSALMASSVAQNSFHAALAMGAFGMGTVPALAATAFGGKFALMRFPKISAHAFRAVMTANGTGLILLALYILL